MGRDVFDVLVEQVNSSLRTSSRLGERFAVRHISSCPRQLWFRAREYDYSNPPSLSQSVLMRWGEGAETLEYEILSAVSAEALGNTMTIHEAIDRHQERYQSLREAIMTADIKHTWKRVETSPFAIRGLPVELTFPGVTRPLLGITDIILLINDEPIVVEVKETRGRSASNIRSGGGPWTSWVTQLYAYCNALSIPGELHVWGRDTGYYTKFQLRKIGDTVVLNGRPYTVDTAAGKLTLDQFITQRLSYIEGTISMDSPPGKMKLSSFGHVLIPQFDGCPMPDDEAYQLCINSRGEIAERVQVKGTSMSSRRCFSCWDRDNCMSAAVEYARSKLLVGAAPAKAEVEV